MENQLQDKVVFISGGVKRVGAVIARYLHQAGMRLALHYHHSEQAALELQAHFNAIRPNSVFLLQGDILQTESLSSFIEQTVQHFGRLDVLINNASSFYPTAIGEITEQMWTDLIGTNLKAPLFLSQAAIPHLRQTQGCIINLVDIHAQRPLKQHPVYCSAKAGLVMLTKSLAKELAPLVRVNGIAPGAILWAASEEADEEGKQRLLSMVPMQRRGEPDDLAKTALFLIRDADYITGQIIAVDGGRTLSQ